jgi:hypothetical protein
MKTLITILVLLSSSVYSEEIKDVSLLCKDSQSSLSTILSPKYLGIEFIGGSVNYFYLETSLPLQTGVLEKWGYYEAQSSIVKLMAGTTGKIIAIVNRSTLKMEIQEENILIWDDISLKKNDLRCEIFTNNILNLKEYLKDIWKKRDKEIINKNKF